MDRAEQVRRVIGARGLSLYRVSQQSAQTFGRTSRFYVPHNLYSDVTDASLIPTVHQLLALSHITNYRLCDWLAVFGFDLDLIPQLQLLAPRSRTTLLDSSVYDVQAWLPWFAEREPAAPVPPIAPLTQFLAPASPRRAADLLAQGKRRFLYGKVGESDLHAFPQLAPGSIVRVDAEGSSELLSAQASSRGRLYFLEHDLGWTCSQLVPLARDRVLAHSPQHPCAQMEIKLGKEARILGVIDAELRPVWQTPHVRMPPVPSAPGKVPVRGSRRTCANVQDLLRCSRMRAGLSFREASSMSRWIANRLGDQLYFAAASTLSDYETLSVPPRHLQKLITLCILYSIGFFDFLRSCDLPLERAGREPIPDDLVPRAAPNSPQNVPVSSAERGASPPGGFLGSLVSQWGEVPLFLRSSLSELAGLKKFSVSDVFWVGGDNRPNHPWLADATFVAVNRRIKRPVESPALPFCQQPLYLLLKRDGHYLSGPCSLVGGDLVVPAYAGGPSGAQHFRNGTDAEVIGQITLILRRIR